MAGPLIGLAVNLVLLRNRSVKWLGLALLAPAILLHGYLSFHPARRMLNVHRWYGTPIDYDLFYHIIAVAAFDVCLGLTFWVFFAVIPLDALPRFIRYLRERRIRRTTA